jgi:hypothetical protein
LDERAGYEGAHVLTIWSPRDEVINVAGAGSLVWGEVTSRIEGQSGELVVEAGHLGTRDETTRAQIEWVERHELR